MLRWFSNFGARLSRSKDFTRCFTTETLKSLEEIDRDKKMKIYELEIDVGFKKLLTEIMFTRFLLSDASTRRTKGS